MLNLRQHLIEMIVRNEARRRYQCQLPAAGQEMPQQATGAAGQRRSPDDQADEISAVPVELATGTPRSPAYTTREAACPTTRPQVTL